MFPPRLLGFLTAFALATLLSGCATGRLAALASVPLVNNGAKVMNRETDLALARAAAPAQLELIRSPIAQLPDNSDLRLRAAQGFYGYAYSFVENKNPARASALYRRAFNDARIALAQDGLRGDLTMMSEANLTRALRHLHRHAVPALFWTAMCWAKWINMNRDSPALLAEMGNAVALMRRAESLDGNYYYGGAHLFFGAYYSSLPPFAGGNLSKAAQEFVKARAATSGKLLLVDVLEAQYLERQTLNRKTFHAPLIHVLKAPSDLFPQMALANAVAKEKAKRLLAHEEDWFRSDCNVLGCCFCVFSFLVLSPSRLWRTSGTYLSSRPSRPMVPAG